MRIVEPSDVRSARLRLEREQRPECVCRFCGKFMHRSGRRGRERHEQQHHPIQLMELLLTQMKDGIKRETDRYAQQLQKEKR